VELRALAEQVLFGARLEDKLIAVGMDQLTDTHPGPAVGRVDLPGRPAALALRAERERVPFPSLHTLDRPRQRGRMLHFFANHELLAMELLALGLLRFPDAPTEFRRGLAGTLLDEQTHMRLYLQRMADDEVALGEIPVSRHFWDVIASMQSPMDFVIRMSLTFEQANLDFAAYYGQAFERAGDRETSAVLARVLEDEIRHVAHGVTWFERWRGTGDAFETYQRLLPSPLTPSRAKGRQLFHRDAREQAGLSSDFIDRLQDYGGSRGRAPDVHLANVGCEAEIAFGPGHTPKGRLAALATDLETLPLLLAGDDDLVVVSRRPSREYTTALRQAGFAAPEIRVAPPNQPVPLDHARLGRLLPWGWSPAVTARLGSLVDRCHPESVDALGGANERSEIFTKTWSAALLRALGDARSWPDWWCEPSAVGTCEQSLEAVRNRVRSIREAGYANVVVKSPLGTSGRGAVRILDGDWPSSATGWIERTLTRQGAVVVEPWLHRVADLSIQIRVPLAGPVIVVGTTRFLTDSRGQFLGTILGKPTLGLPVDILRWLSADGRNPRRFPNLIADVAETVGDHLQSAGHVGPAGIDLLIYRREHDGALRLKPLVEINPRTTMGHVALALRGRLAPRTAGIWCLLSAPSLRRAGFESSAEFAEYVQSAHPLVQKRGWRRGGLFTTDPQPASQVVGLALIGETLAACASAFTSFGLPIPPEATR